MINNDIHEALAGYIRNQDIAGAALVVNRNGRTVHEEYAGFADIANGIFVDQDTLFRLASMTKPIISVAIMMAEEKGLLSLEDEVSKYIPEFSDLSVSPEKIQRGKKIDEEKVKGYVFEKLSRPVIIEDLLRHRSGIGHGAVSEYFGLNERLPISTLKERMKQIASCPLDFQPGTQSGYSPRAAFDIMGRILEIVFDEPIALLLDRLLFRPLDMKSTMFFPDAEQRKRIPRLYERPGDTLIDVTPKDGSVNPLANGYPGCGGGLFGTLSDYEHFARMLACGGEYEGAQILKTETVRRMAQTAPVPEGSMWGLGMMVFKPLSESGRYLSDGTFGWSGAYGTHFYVDPVNDLFMVLMANRADIGGSGSYVSHGMEKAIFEALALKEK